MDLAAGRYGVVQDRLEDFLFWECLCLFIFNDAVDAWLKNKCAQAYLHKLVESSHLLN